MNGAESLIQTALAAGIDVCFANPGTTEMPLVAALDAVPGMRAVLGLFEGVCSGAADGYARMKGRPALTLTHLGPGFANSIANLHNARRAHSPIVNIVGDQATWHLAADAPLTSDIASLARPVSAWIREVKTADEVAQATAEAVAAAGGLPGKIATLIIPSDCQWETVVSAAAAAPIKATPSEPVPERAIGACAELLRRHGAKTVLFLGGMSLRERGLKAAARIAAKTGCALVCETFPSRIERGGAMPSVLKLPYFPEQALEMLSRFTAMVVAGTRAPVAFFGYPNLPSSLVPEGQMVETLANIEHDSAGALEALADALGAAATMPAASSPRPSRPTGELNAQTIGAALSAMMPENCIVMDEAATTGLPFFVNSGGAPPHTYLGLTGGAIGQGLPCATGAAVACPDCKVIAFQADGSGMYTLQALWTQARESLNVTNLICNNRRYRILQVELARSGVTEPGRMARTLTSLAQPEIDWSRMASGLGVPAVRVDNAESLCRELERALKEPGPNLVEMLI
ncbi:MAG: acetolactate synthase large subunit [Candidatus Binataceae bacterium]